MRETERERAREKREENKKGPRAEGTAQDGVQQKHQGGPEGRLGRSADDSLSEHTRAAFPSRHLTSGERALDKGYKPPVI